MFVFGEENYGNFRHNFYQFLTKSTQLAQFLKLCIFEHKLISRAYSLPPFRNVGVCEDDFFERKWKTGRKLED